MADQERRLLEQAQAGGLASFSGFVRHFERRIRTVLFRLLDDERDVEEATQDTFVQAWRNLERFRGDAAPFTWLYRIAVNEALMRKRRRRIETVEYDDAQLPDQVDAVERGALRAIIVEQIRALPFEYRAALVLRDVEGLSNVEVAQVLEISVAAAKSRIHRARMMLREQLSQQGALDA